MAVNLQPYAKDLNGGLPPLILHLPVAAGATTPIKRGEICELSAGVWTPITGDDAFSGEIAICNQEITEVSKAGHYPFIIPRRNDLFEFELAAEAAIARGASLYFSTSQVLASSGSNAFGKVFDHAGYPRKQGKADVGDVADRGSTVGTTKFVLMTFDAATTYLAALQG